jgi:hypothetical protein
MNLVEYFDYSGTMKTDQIATAFTALGQNTWLELIRTLLAADPLVLAR